MALNWLKYNLQARNIELRSHGLETLTNLAIYYEKEAKMLESQEFACGNRFFVYRQTSFQRKNSTNNYGWSKFQCAGLWRKINRLSLRFSVTTWCKQSLVVRGFISYNGPRAYLSALPTSSSHRFSMKSRWVSLFMLIYRYEYKYEQNL